MSTSVLTAGSFANPNLNTYAGVNATLYQRTAYNAIGATSATAVNIGQLVTGQTQLDVVSQVTDAAPTDYYTFNLQGTSLKAAFQNVTNSTDLRFQLYDSKGNLVADSQGTAAQQTAYVQLTTSGGLTATAGQYTAKVTYAPNALKSLSQSYSLSLYSGNTFQSAYQTTAVAQATQSTLLPVDNTLTYATSTAQVYSRQIYNQINASPSTALNIGWLAENTSQLNLQSQITPSDNKDYYSFTFQKGTAIKLAFNNTTSANTTTPLRVQLLDSSGLHVVADSDGTTAQQAAYAQLTSSTGLTAQSGGNNYIVKVSYAPGAETGQTQNYNFQLYSGTSYSSGYYSTASAQTYGNALLTGTGTGVYNPASAVASYMQGVSQGNATNIFTTLSKSA